MFFRKKKNNINNKSDYGWRGNYSSWEDALRYSGGYEATNILEKVKDSLLKIKLGEAVYERDSVLFDKKEYSWGVLAILMKAAVESEGKLNLIDFGGSLGSSYFQNRDFLSSLSEIKWNVVEQKSFVDTGKQFFENEELNFFYDLKSCVIETKSRVFFSSGTIQYLSDPFQFLKMLKNFDFKYLVFDRIAFIDVEKDLLTVQRVPPEVYDASYPAWFFNYDKFVRFFEDKYVLVSDFDNGFTAPAIVEKRRAYWRGFIFKKK